jgi:hypothetical protein
VASKIELFETLRAAKLNNPNDVEAHNLIRAEIFTFDVTLSTSEKDLFEYCDAGYVELNPGINNNSNWSSYIGDHISDSGEHS